MKNKVCDECGLIHSEDNDRMSIKEELKELRLDTEEWFNKMDKEILR